jgi:hypothetical protein
MAHVLQKKSASFVDLGTKRIIEVEQGIKTMQKRQHTDRFLMHQFANDVRAAQTVQAVLRRTNSEDSVVHEKKAFTFVSRSMRVPRTGVFWKQNTFR